MKSVAKNEIVLHDPYSNALWGGLRCNVSCYVCSYVRHLRITSLFFQRILNTWNKKNEKQRRWEQWKPYREEEMAYQARVLYDFQVMLLL